ncbi:SCL-interrupting locus protein homolog [Scophthalmus maximus]|uniref:SCL-interrupting locus protein homolog n=1 Tax=Scophthalmus maximus TaxID=52904 RepID=UPI001FA91FFA|nr:SCL-interrupting locus protein homolog [Scophthalmus maximus]
MSCPVKLQDLPTTLFEQVFTPENVRGRSTNSLTPLSFPKSRSALWDGSAAGDKFRLQLCSHRKPHVVLLEKALRLAQRHVRHSNKPRLECFFLGSVSVDADEEGVTVTLDRFDPGRDQAVSSGGRVPSALLPGDVLVPCLFSTQREATPDAVVQSEAELHHCFKVLQQCVSSRQTLDLSQLLKVRGRVVCSQQSDVAAISLSWSLVCPSVSVDVQPVRAVPIIPTALLRSLTSVGRPQHHHTAGRQRGFVTMDQTRKLLLLLESDPKASNLPLVGLWLSGVTHVYSPQVWAWCLRFLCSAALQDRVLSESGCFLLVLFAATHRAPQFYQCRGPGPRPGPGLQLDCELLTAFQSVTLYQVAPADGRTLQCELSSELHSRQTQIFRDARSSFNGPAPPAPGLSATDQDSGVEDEDLSPRPSPSPHAPAQQSRRVQPSVPELSLLIDSSFTSNHCGWQDAASAHRLDRRSVPPSGNSSSPAPPPRIHSTPNSNLQPPCSCCSAHSYYPTPICSSPTLLPAPTPPPFPPPSSHHTPPPSSSHHTLLSTPLSPAPPHVSPSPHPSPLPRPNCVTEYCGRGGGVVPADTYQLLLHQDRQLRLLQAQVQMLLEAQGKIQVNTQMPRRTTSIAVGTGDSLLWADPVKPHSHQEEQVPPPSSPSPLPSHDLSITTPVGGSEDCDITHQGTPCSSTGQLSCLQSPVLGESVSMCRADDELQSFYHNLRTQLTSRLQESDSRQEVQEEVESRRGRSLSVLSDSSSRRKQQSPGDAVVSATLRQLQQLGVDMDQEDLTESERNRVRTVESTSTLASINPAAVLSRLSVSNPTVSSLFPGGSSVDLSLEANAIALRYLSDSQLSRLAVGGHTPRRGPASSSSSTDFLLSPSNMSLATRKYMRRYGLIEEEDSEDEDEQEEDVGVQEASTTRQVLTDAPVVNLLPQSQLIRDLQPKMQLLARNTKPNAGGKENCSSRRPSLVRASSHQTEGSVGNILDLSRLRELPKLF